MTKSKEQEELFFSVGEVAKLFFGKSVAWVRAGERTGYFVREDGTPVEPDRSSAKDRGGYGERRYTVNMIEEMGDSLWRQKRISAVERDRLKKRIEAFR